MGPPGALQGPQRWPRVGSVMDPGGRCGRCLRRRKEGRNNQRKWPHRGPIVAQLETLLGPPRGAKGPKGGQERAPRGARERALKNRVLEE
jgi:hypothetical protein